MVTIKDIATKTGLSSATVSRILNHDPNLKVPDATRNKVLEEAEKMGYVKRKFNRKSNYKPMKVGIVHWYTIEKELRDPFYMEIRMAVENTLNKNNAKIIRIFKDDLPKGELDDIDGLICIGKFSHEEIADFRKLTDHLIFIDMSMDRIIVNNVVLDFRHAVYDALLHLTSLGHKKIGFLGGIETVGNQSRYPDQRKYYFQEFCQNHGINYKNYIKEDQFSIESGYHMMKEMIDNQDLPTAIFAASDQIAIGALRALNEAGLKVPDDLSIIGFNNDSSSAFTTPPLTTINAPCEKIGEIAAMTLINMRSQKKVYPQRITIPCELVIRQSTATINKK